MYYVWSNMSENISYPSESMENGDLSTNLLHPVHSQPATLPSPHHFEYMVILLHVGILCFVCVAFVSTTRVSFTNWWIALAICCLKAILREGTKTRPNITICRVSWSKTKTSTTRTHARNTQQEKTFNVCHILHWLLLFAPLIGARLTTKTHRKIIFIIQCLSIYRIKSHGDML